MVKRTSLALSIAVNAVTVPSLLTFVACIESSLDSIGGMPRADVLKMPRWSNAPSAITMQFSAKQNLFRWVHIILLNKIYKLVTCRFQETLQNL